MTKAPVVATSTCMPAARTRRSPLTAAQVKQIAAVYDGTTAKIDELVAQYDTSRVAIQQAAIRGGYKRARPRKRWTPEMDQYLTEHYGLRPIDDLCAHLGVTPLAIQSRKTMLKLSSWKKAEEIGYKVIELEALTKLSHKIWTRFIEAGELRCTTMVTYKAERAMRVVSVDDLHEFLRRRPEFLNPDKIGLAGRAALELFNLPAPPLFKRLVCSSEANAAREIQANTSGPFHHGVLTHRTVQTVQTRATCAEEPFAFWSPIHSEQPACPRCGSLVSRFSPDRIYLDEDPDEGEVMQMIASKIGLSYADGKIVDAAGNVVSEHGLLEYAFAQKRNPKIAFRVFSHLIKQGLTPAVKRPADLSRWLVESGVDYQLRERQLEELERLKRDSNICVTWPPGEGKMFFLGYVFGMIPGEHAVFVNTKTLAEEWALFLEKHWRWKVKIRWSNKPTGIKVRLFRADGSLHGRIDIWTYLTGNDFREQRYGVVGYDEAHFLPGTSAHRFALLATDIRVGLTASPYREDGRASLIGLLTGDAGHETWAEVLAERPTALAEIEVVVVDDVDGKHAAVRTLLPPAGRGIIFVEALQDGHRLSSDLGLPFVFSETKDRVATIKGNPVTICSRVADHGLDITDLEWLIEFGFQKGSRSQQLQRYGRLLHSNQARRHTILMTRDEITRYAKRLTGLEAQGLRFSMRVAD